jgi:hypothetical protein
MDTSPKGEGRPARPSPWRPRAVRRSDAAEDDQEVAQDLIDPVQQVLQPRERAGAVEQVGEGAQQAAQQLALLARDGQVDRREVEGQDGARLLGLRRRAGVRRPPPGRYPP